MIFTLILMVLMVINVEAISIGVSKGITICMTNVVPSLLVFMIMSDIVINLNTNSKIKPKWKAFMLGSICGFPVGSHICDNLYSNGEISEKESKVLSVACNNASPAFVIGAIGNSMLGDKKLGILIYLAEIMSSAIFVMRIKNVSNFKDIEKEQSLIKILTESIEKTVAAIFRISIIICFFSGILELVSRHTNNSVYLIASSLLEISNGAIAGSALFEKSPVFSIAFLAFTCGFGGLCAHMQIITAQKSIKVRYLSVLFQKLIQGLLTCVLAVVGYKVLNMLEIYFAL